jgi:hypothetical protein
MGVGGHIGLVHGSPAGVCWHVINNGSSASQGNIPESQITA